MWGRLVAMIMLSPTMVQRSLSVYVGTTFGKLNVTPEVEHLLSFAKKTLKTTTKPK
jgi:ribosomal protein S19